MRAAGMTTAAVQTQKTFQRVPEVTAVQWGGMNEQTRAPKVACEQIAQGEEMVDSYRRYGHSSTGNTFMTTAGTATISRSTQSIFW